MSETYRVNEKQERLDSQSSRSLPRGARLHMNIEKQQKTCRNLSTSLIAFQKLNRNEDRSMGKIRKSLMHLETGVSVVSAHSRKEEWKMMFQ